MKKLVISVALVTALLIVLTGTALADNGPHGGTYGPTTDACAGCHRAHTATGPRLLTSTNTAQMCLSCHGSTGTGADTNVIDGIYVERDGNAETPAEGVPGRGLLGGGFTNALMDTNADGASGSAPTTSTHLYDGTAGTVWGYGPISATANNGLAAFPLGCGNCHNPHGKSATPAGPTYRILRSVPTGTFVPALATTANVADQATKLYTVADPTNNYYGQPYTGYTVSMSAWCAQCHTRYLAPTGSGSTNSGDAVFMYRHVSNGDLGMACTSCHVSHGTSAASTALASSASLAGDSAMLRLDNRGVCQACHNK